MRKVFVACSRGIDNSVSRADLLLQQIIKPVIDSLFEENSAEVITRSDIPLQVGMMSERNIDRLRAADILIADLSDLNSNVLYELKLRQSIMKPYVLMAESGTEIPEQLSEIKAIIYNLDDCESARKLLAEALKKALTCQFNLLGESAALHCANEGQSCYTAQCDQIYNSKLG